MSTGGAEGLFELTRDAASLGPGAVHIPGWMSREQQQFLFAECMRWAVVSPPIRPSLPGGGTMTVGMLCLGRRWVPYRYLNDGQVLPMPDWLVRAGRQALERAADVDERAADGVDALCYTPDAALVNFYRPGATMGLHQDRDEADGSPVVSLSLGDSCLFRFGTPENRGRPYTDVRLDSGDLVVFGGPSRLAYHGVPTVYADTAPSWCAEKRSYAPVRINLTLRRTRSR